MNARTKCIYLAGFRARDEALLYDFVRMKKRSLWQFIKRKSGYSFNDDEIHDIAQKSFLEVWNFVASGVGDDFDCGVYLLYRAALRVKDRLRSARKHGIVLKHTNGADICDPKAGHPEEQLLVEDLSRHFDAVLAGLSSDHRAAISWAKNHDPPDWSRFREKTGIPEKRARKLASEARAKLRAALLVYESGDEEGKGGSHGNRQTA